MSLIYHHKSFALLGVTPKISERHAELVVAFESKYKLRFPDALREWYLLDNNVTLLQKLAVIHNVVEISDMPKIQKDYCNPFSALAPLPILVENQWVWHMAVKLDEGDNPPVYLRYNEPNEPWRLHANSFSDWIHALSWDYIHLWDSRGKTTAYHKTISFTSETANYLSGFQVAAPETYLGNVYYVAKKFVRMKKDNEPLLVLHEEADA